jgi:hypothetical protein
MTPDEAFKAMAEITGRRGALIEKIGVEARAVVPVLLDAGRVNSAKPLQELLFEMDALEQEMTSLFTENHEAVLAAMLATVRAKRGAP